MWQTLKNYYHWLQALAAALFFGFPSKKLIVIGVTGTDGKTTTVNMIYHVLKHSGCQVSLISSVNAKIGDKSYETGFHVTTPDPWDIQKFLRKAVDAKSEYFVLEATSHGLDQNRLAFANFKIGVVTNITHEHLDYHKTWPNYAAAKAKLFKNVDFSILNYDDKKSFEFLKNRVDGKILTYSQKNLSDFNLKNFPIKLKLNGDYNLSNALAAAAVCSAANIDKKKIIAALANFAGVVGRMEEVDLGQDFKIIVDFAHTPNSLEQALKTLRSLRSNVKGQMSKVICVFGSAGERDQTKRPLMGQVADKFADIIVLTAEDPRSEKPEDICRQIMSGIKKKQGLRPSGLKQSLRSSPPGADVGLKKEGKDLFIIPDRKEAIQFAINLAKKNDTVAIFGKSHEKSMTYDHKDYPWDEFATVKAAIRERLKK